jgi:hypothetical protein
VVRSERSAIGANYGEMTSTQRPSVLWLSLPLAALAGFSGCGEGDDVDMGETGNGGSTTSGGSGATASGGTVSFGGSGNAGSSSGGGNGGSNTNPCGDQPCANHTGDKTFVAAGIPESVVEDFESGDVRPSGSDAEREPGIVYPSHETMFPINVSHIRHEWRAGTDNTLFELTFEGPNTTVRVYTGEGVFLPDAPNWTPSEEEWDWIAESNRGAAVTLTVRGLAAGSTDVFTSTPIELYFSESEVEGAIYYWSTGTQGVMKALISDPVPVKFYTDPAAEDAETCVACHTLSRDGKRLAVGYGGEKLREASVPERETLVPSNGAEDMASAWTTFSPDGELLLVAASGKLTLIDSDTGERVGPDDGLIPLPDGVVATHPDWSALGDRVAITLGTNGGNKEVEGGQIALLPYDDGTWGEPEILVPSAGGEDNNFFPVWSPDSRFIAYVNAQGKSKDALTARLKLVTVADGSVTELVRINERVNDEDGVVDIGNSMPTWAPSTKPGIFWLAFSSLRAYGSVRPQDDKEDQIWIAAIDPDGEDPSFSAFWAPFQSIDEGNHRAFWTHTGEDQQCLCQDICDDDFDNDCDGTADEDDCIVECLPQEICDDGIDNDCDCVIDDCVVEICDDDIDNDGDGLTDGDDPTCQIPK